MEAYGSRIRGSCLYRAFCAHCGEPMRVTAASLYDEHGHRLRQYCRDCGNRDHVGCSSPPSPNDPDAWQPSTQEDYGDIPGA